MALPRSRKRKIIIVIIILSARIDGDLENEIEGTIHEQLMGQIAAADSLLFNVEPWNSRHEEAWTAFEEIHDALEAEGANAQDLESLSGAFGDKLAEL